MSKELEELLFKTIEGAINYGANYDGYGEFTFSELYAKLERLENEASNNRPTR